MELKEFIKEVLKDVTEAVDESTSKQYLFSLMNTTNTGIDFDVAIVSKVAANGKSGVEIFNIFEAKAEGGISQEKVNRIKFKVFPHPLIREQQDLVNLYK